MKNIKGQNINRTISFLISLFLVINLVAQDISFNYLSTENGLSQFTAYCLYKDELGRIWIGTRDGLNVYNGNWVRSYKPERGNEHSILGKDIRKICGDAKGHLYIQTIEGVCTFDMHTETFETIQEGSGYSITYSSDTLLIGGNGFVYYYDVLNHEVKPYCSIEGDMQVSSMLKDKAGRLWVGTRDKGLYCLKEGQMKQLCALPQCNVFNLYQDSSGDIWVCTWEDGLYHISDNGTVHYTDKGIDKTRCISSNSVRDCCEDNQGNLWVATFNGLDKFDKKKNEFAYYTSTDISGSLSNASVYCIIKDHQGTLWVGTYFGGVNYFNPEYEIYTHYRPGLHENEGLSFPVIGCFAEDKRGNLWIATEGGDWTFMIVPTSVSNGINIERVTTLSLILKLCTMTKSERLFGLVPIRRELINWI